MIDHMIVQHCNSRLPLLQRSLLRARTPQDHIEALAEWLGAVCLSTG